MGLVISRRAALMGTIASLAVGLGAGARADGEIETHGLSSFGELALPPDFKFLDYVNPQAPKGGKLALQVSTTSGNQNFETFDTFNMYSKKGDGAAGLSGCFDSLMSGNADEPDSMYGLVAKSVRYSADKLTYKFRMRPEARFWDGSRLTAADVAFSLTTLKEKGHPTYGLLLRDIAGAEAESEDVVVVRFVPERGRDSHLLVAGMPIFSRAFWSSRDFEASTFEPPLGSGAYKIGKYEPGRFIEYDLVSDYWGKDLPLNIGLNNFATLRFDYYRDRQVGFEAFKAGKTNFRDDPDPRAWTNGYDFPAFNDGRVKKQTLKRRGPHVIQAWYYNVRREQFADPRIREALGLAFDFEWTNKNVMFGMFERVVSYFGLEELQAKGPPSPGELALLEPFRGRAPEEVFGEPYVPPPTDGSGSDRALLRRANEMLLAAGCKREGSNLKLPNGKPFVIEFLDKSDYMEPRQQPFQQNLRKLGIDAHTRIVDSTQYKSRVDDYDFDITTMALGSSPTPGVELRLLFGSKAGKAPRSRNLSGIDDPIVDALIDKAAGARTREELRFACRALDRVLRAGRYWIPQWYDGTVRFAFWDAFSAPERQPALGSGAPDTWWWDTEKAKKIGL